MNLNPGKTLNNLMSWLLAIGVLFCVLFASTLAYWGMDRNPPFVMSHYEVTPVKAGETTVVTGYVKRDFVRKCKVMYSRTLVDSSGVRYELTDGAQMMNASSLKELYLTSPDRMQFGVVIPKNASPGLAHIYSSLDYECNPIHQFYPITFTLDMNLVILPS